jgi:WD40 repeat protein
MTTTQAPARPAYILRGHAAQIHAVLFIQDNSRLLTGDADGWVILWHTTTKRAVVVWRAHRLSILGFAIWSDDKIIT